MLMNRKKSKRSRLGQNTVEYVLLLFFVVMAVKSVGGNLTTRLKGVVDAAFNKVDQAVENE